MPTPAYHQPTRATDYTAITELPGSLLTRDQMRRFAQRYMLASKMGTGRCVLEVACGVGGGLGLLAQQAQRVVGMDYTATVLAQARHATPLPLVQGDAQSLPFADGSFDQLLCFEAIYYLADYPAFLAESRRVLAKGGMILLCQSNPDWPDFVPGALTTHYPSLPELTAALAAAGFTALTCCGTLPRTRASLRQQVTNRLRRYLLQGGLLPRLGPLTALLKRLSYGEMIPLPASLTPGAATSWAADLPLTPLPPHQPDRTHRVIYVRGSIAGPLH